MNKRVSCLFLGIFFSLVSSAAIAANNTVTPSSDSGSEMALFEDIPVVTSAAGREQKLDDVANAMYVITQEDIERSGARELPDLLYRVPGLQIRQIDGHQYGVGIRQNGSYITNNLLILIDGAVVFDPAFGGTTWETLPVSLNEIERIEIILGSPGVLYSSNAVNGVINIITKTADTKNNYIQQEGGTQSYRDSSIGLGLDKIGTTGLAIRAYLDNQFDQGLVKNTYQSFSDRYLSDRDGARLDYTPSDHQRLSIIANNNQQNSNSPNFITGVDTKQPGQIASAIINYTDKVTDKYDYSFHFDHVEELGSLFLPDDVIVHVTNVSTQHNFHYDLFGANITTVGGELTYNDLHVAPDNGTTGLLTNGQASQKIISFFAQDEYRPIEKLILTAGVREDSNSLVINEKPLYSPKLSALYHLTDNQSLWASDSLTWRTPDFVDHDLSLFGGYFRGSTDLKPEEDLTQEVGYRGLFLDQKLKADATLFLTNVHDVIILEGDGFPPYTSNNGSLATQGAELSLGYQWTSNLSFSTDYSYTYPHFKPETPNTPYTTVYDTNVSKNVVGIGSRYTLNKLKLDLYAKYFGGYTDGTTSSVGVNAKVRGYYETSLRISYDFQTPACGKLGKQDATIYLEANDFIGARQTEYDFTDFANPNGVSEIYTKPEITGGIKVTF